MTFGIREAIAIISVVVCGLALYKGSGAERWGALFLMISWSVGVISQLATSGSALSLSTVAAIGLCADIGLACGFLWLALRYSSLWLAAAMMLQAIQLALYGSFLGSGGAHHNEYAAASNIQSGLLLLAILGGTLMSWRRRVTDRHEMPSRRQPSVA